MELIMMNNIKTVLFDLDGTLLPMKHQEFIDSYFYELGNYFSDRIDSDLLLKYVWKSTKSIIMNTDYVLNEEVFWESFNGLVGKEYGIDRETFNKFYETGFKNVQKSTRKSEKIIEIVDLLKENGYDIVIATNPLFPENAVLERIKWAGLDYRDFKLITHLENSHYCKPQIYYYKEIVDKLGLDTSQCMMVGNDVTEDLVAGKLGIKTWLITDCLLNRDNREIVADNSGSYEDFYLYMKNNIGKTPE
jgi:HAD superfamily hydrolase (TIGR01549 family)